MCGAVQTNRPRRPQTGLSRRLALSRTSHMAQLIVNHQRWNSFTKPMNSLALCALLCGGLVFVALPADAQTAAQTQLPDSVQRTRDQLQDAALAADQAKALEMLEGRVVSYDEVLKNPDNPALNAAYARTLIKKGDLLGASTTLERILLTHPDAIEVRLLYGFVLFRLDDTITAKAVLSSIDAARLTEAQQADRNSVLAQIENRNKRLHQTLTVSLGGHFDSDKNAAPIDGSILISGNPYVLTGRATVQKDFGFLASSLYDVDYDLGLDTKTSAFATTNVMRDQQITVHQFDTLNGGIEAGLRHEYGPWRIQTGIFTTQMQLMGQYFLNDYGIETKPVRRLNAEWDVAGDFRFERQSFHDVPADTAGPDNSGITSSGWLGPMWHVTPSQNISLMTGVVKHNASESAYGDYQTNARYGLRMADTLVLEQGQFVLLSGELGDIVYAAPNSLIASATRHDSDSRFGVSYGVPFTTLAKALDTDLADPFGSIILNLHTEYYREFSNLMNYRYTNVRSDAVLTKRWEF